MTNLALNFAWLVQLLSSLLSELSSNNKIFSILMKISNTYIDSFLTFLRHGELFVSLHFPSMKTFTSKWAGSPQPVRAIPLRSEISYANISYGSCVHGEYLGRESRARKTIAVISWKPRAQAPSTGKYIRFRPS